MQVVIDEILQDKIYLDTELNVQVAAGAAAPGYSTGDALADCADPLCAAFPACVPEDCGNGVDDDGDALPRAGDAEEPRGHAGAGWK